MEIQPGACKTRSLSAAESTNHGDGAGVGPLLSHLEVQKGSISFRLVKVKL